MKTKTLLYILMSVLVLSFASCTDDDKIDYLTKEEIPESINTFASKYLPNNKLLSAYIDKDYGGGFYFVEFEGGVKTQFLPEGEWFILESEKGLPETTNTLLSKNSRKKLEDDHATAKIIQLTKLPNVEVEILLDNNKLFVDLITYSDFENVLGEIIPIENMQDVPEKLKSFIQEVLLFNTRTSPTINYSIIKFTELASTKYRLMITPYTFVDFHEDGEWFYMKESETKSIIKDTLIKAIPDGVITALKDEEPNAVASTIEITRFNDNELYVFNLKNKEFVIINSDNEVVEPPLDKAKEYINAGFNPQEELNYEVTTNKAPFTVITFTFTATNASHTINLITHVEGDMHRISAGPISSNENKTVALPKTLLEMLPGDIAGYVEKNYPDKKVIHISRPNPKESFVRAISVWLSIPDNMKVLDFDKTTGEFIDEYDIIIKQE